MKKKRPKSWCLVVDASIARAAGPPESRHPTGAHCRDFLIALRGVGHRMAWSEAIKTEWDKHESSFARQWRVSMVSLGKLRPVTDEQDEELRVAIEDHSDDENVVALMLKDAHLIEAAFATDSRVASLDDTVRGHFRQLAVTLDSLRAILWVNPANEDEQTVSWLEKGAPAHPTRRFKP
jgi:hypothetical protein